MVRKIIFVVSLLSSIAWGATRYAANVFAKRDFTGYLKQAADANTPELAKSKLSAAIAGIEKRGLTSGYTSIFYNTPDEDLGFWYNNLKASENDLQKLSPNASQLEQSNVLMKLRQTLLDHEKNGEAVTCPAGASLYPYNLVMAIWGTISVVFLFCAGIACKAQGDFG